MCHIKQWIESMGRTFLVCSAKFTTICDKKAYLYNGILTHDLGQYFFEVSFESSPLWSFKMSMI